MRCSFQLMIFGKQLQQIFAGIHALRKAMARPVPQERQQEALEFPKYFWSNSAFILYQRPAERLSSTDVYRGLTLKIFFLGSTPFMLPPHTYQYKCHADVPGHHLPLVRSSLASSWFGARNACITLLLVRC